VASTRFKARHLHANLSLQPVFEGAPKMAFTAGLLQTSKPELKEVASSCLHRVRFCYRSQCMSVFPSPAQERPVVPVRSIGANAWVIICTAERIETRARHGRARWSLCAGLRRRPACLKRA
jgi:hypothetical protein